MQDTLFTLMVTAASLGVIHTLIGPDHYLPFIVMSKSRGWTISKTMFVTFACGLGHVLSSVVLGLVGIGLGVAVFKLEGIEAFRGDIAAWMLTAFGLVYMVWGVRQGVKNKPHKHIHDHGEGNSHAHEHNHHHNHAHVHEQPGKTATPWMLFLIFIFGPCEVLIPLLMVPASKFDMVGSSLVALVFGLSTMLTMMGVVLCASFGLRKISLGPVERFSHALAGLTILICAVMIHLGL